MKRIDVGIGLSWLLGLALTSTELRAQQLEPRAYSPSPVGMNFLGVAAMYTGGGVVTDPALALDKVSAHVFSAAPFFAHTFDLVGRLANVSVALPYAWMTATVEDDGETHSGDRSGWVDPSARLAMNLIGGPAMTPQQFRERIPETALGASITVTAPFGQYDSSYLVNLGTNRWAFRTDLGLSQPVGAWLFELYSGAWFFTANDAYHGDHVREQGPLLSMQAHVVYVFRPGLWAAGDFTYYEGGSTKLDGVSKDNRQANARVGVTMAYPITSGQSVKLGLAEGATTRIGQNFTTVALSWDMHWD